MSTFREFVRMIEADEPAPPGVDPEMWAAASDRMKAWLRSQAIQSTQQPAVQSQQSAVLSQPKVAARALGSRLQGTPGVPEDTRYTKVPEPFYNRWKHEYDRLPRDVLKWFTDQGFRWNSISARPGTYRWMPPMNYPMPRV